VTLITSQSANSTAPNNIQVQMDELIQQLKSVEDDKRNITQEKDDLQKQLGELKDQLLDAERRNR
jgi:predicted transcriptional regulator